MVVLNDIGLDKKRAEVLANSLNDLLGNYSIFYQNMRGYHWKVKGANFFELHEKFEELYHDLFEKIDEVAERILTLGYSPNHCFSSYLKTDGIKEAIEAPEAKDMVKDIVESFRVLLVKQRGILNSAGEMGDEGTNALMSDYIREQEKLVWMYSAYLK